MRAPLLVAPSLHVALALALVALAPAPARAQCAPLVPPPGYVIGSCGTAVGTTCPASCAPGYWGTALSPFCQANGTWTAFTGCTMVTCPSPAAPGYTLTCDGTTFGSTCAVGCDEASGYVGAPTAGSIACGGSGEWSPPPGGLSGCALATCAAPPAATGYAFDCAGTSFGDMCTVTCATGYVGLPVTPFVSCGLGVWSPDPAINSGCVLADCGPPAALAGYAVSCPGTTYLSSCAVACDGASGYVGTPSAAALTCRADATWSAATGSLTGCAPATCAAPAAPAGYAVTCAGTSFGDGCAITCATGYVGAPATTAITCGLAGWSASPGAGAGCTPVDCGTPTIPGAEVSGCAAHARFGEGACTPPCTEGHSGSPSATCAATGAWAITGGCSPIPCWPSPGTNGDSCGTAGQACLSGGCAVPAAGQLCTTPFTLTPGVERVFALDGQHDLLAATRCPGDLDAGKDVFVEFAATAARPYRVEVSAEGAAGLDALALGSCAATACAVVDPDAATSTTLVATVEPASAATIVLAVHVRGAPAGAAARVTVTPVPDAAPGPPGPPSPPGGSGCGCASAPAAAGIWAALALSLALPARRRRRRA